MNYLRIVSYLLLAILVGCATARSTPGAVESTGQILNHTEIPFSSTYWNRDYAQAMGGILGLLMVDITHGTPRHFRYDIKLQDQRTVTVRSRTEVNDGDCVRVWLASTSPSQESFGLGQADIEKTEKCE